MPPTPDTAVIKSMNPLQPIKRLAAGVGYRDDQSLIELNAENDDVRKSAKQATPQFVRPDVPFDSGKGCWCRPNPA